jgi:hypothetical protein
MSFLTNIFSATVKTVLTPIAIVRDVANVATGENTDATKEHLESVAEDVADAFDDLGDGEFI